MSGPVEGEVYELVPGGELAVTRPRRGPSPVEAYLGRLGEGSRRAQLGALELVADLLTQGRAGAMEVPWELVTYGYSQWVRSQLAGRFSAAYTNKVLSALRGVLREAWRLGLMSQEECERACDLRSLKASPLLSGRAVSAGELVGLFEACAREGTALADRDAALLGLLYSGGLRRSDAVGLDFSGWRAAEGVVVVERTKSVPREVPLAPGAAAALGAWVERRGRWPGPLVNPIGRKGEVVDRRLSEQAVWKALRRRSQQAGIVLPTSPHDLRRSMISDMLDAGADISTVQRIAGHRSVVTTQRYDRRGEQTKRKAANLLHVPYRGRRLPGPG